MLGSGLSLWDCAVRGHGGSTPALHLSLSSAVTHSEGDSGTVDYVWTLTLTRAGSTDAYDFDWAVTGTGPNSANAADFGGTFPSGSGTFTSAQTTKTITVSVSGDATVEEDETFLLTVTAAGLNSPTSIGTITNDDEAGGDFTVNPPSLTVVTPNDEYPPEIDALLGEDILVGDTIKLRYSHDATFTTGVTIVSRTAADTPTVDFDLTDITSGTNRFQASVWRSGVQVSDWGADGTAGTLVTHGPDDLAPALSSPTASSTGTTAATVGVTTDTGEGTIYIVLVLTNSQPSAAQIKAGQNSAGASAAKTGSISPASSGAKTANLTGLTSATDYYAFFMHEDATGNQSNIVGAAKITTDAAPAFAMSETAAPAIVVSPGGTNYTFTAADIGAADSTRTIYVAVDFYNSGGALAGLTIGGVSATKLIDHFSTTGGYLYKLDVPAAPAADIVVQSASAFLFVGIKVWRVVGGGTATVTKPDDGGSGSSASVSGTVPVGGGAIVIGGIYTNSGSPVWSNATAVSTTVGSINTFMSASTTTAGSTTIGFSGFSGFPQIYITGVFIPPA
jgi:hypothetical protein